MAAPDHAAERNLLRMMGHLQFLGWKETLSFLSLYPGFLGTWGEAGWQKGSSRSPADLVNLGSLIWKVLRSTEFCSWLGHVFCV